MRLIFNTIHGEEVMCDSPTIEVVDQGEKFAEYDELNCECRYQVIVGDSNPSVRGISREEYELIKNIHFEGKEG